MIDNSEPDEATTLVTRVEPRTPSGWRTTVPGLPDDLLRDSARRLRVIALIYAGGFFVGEAAYWLLDPVARRDIIHWGSVAISITVALVVAVLAGSRRIPAQSVMNIGLAFEVVAAYGIAVATYWGVYRELTYQPEHLAVFGLSFVAPWIMFFTIVSPNEPRKALLTAIAAGSSVPVTVMLTVRYGGTSITMTQSFVVNDLFVPYAMIVVTAYVGAHVVYKLGTSVTRAREMGSYRLTERLGGGGMGEVWRAKHRMLARPAAIKLIRPDLLRGSDGESQRTLLRRFEREAQATALMRSPHTIDVYDFGVTADGTFYYVMELLSGFDLQTFVERFGPLSAARVVYLLRQVCASLIEAHDNDLIHRDLKPANIYLCRQGLEVDFVKVLDFGMVKRRQESALDDAKLTAEHVVAGTPAYIAPEQARGEVVDARTDIYAVGCVGYWLLTGRLVFEATTPLEMLAHHLETPPTAPSLESELAIPKALDEAILACLEKDPTRRPQRANDLYEMLTAADPATAWTSERAREWWDLHQQVSAEGSETEDRRIQVV